MNADAPEVQAGPVVKVARDLTEILAMYATLHDQAEAHGDAHDMPGGRAMAALGNVANMEAWENQQQATERYGRAYTSVADEDPDESWSAFQLLEFWSEQWRAEHGAEYGQRPTIASEANFIRHSLDWAWDHELHWDDFAADINRARVALENVLYAGRRVELTRIECDTCEPIPREDGSKAGPRLIRLIGASDDGHGDRWKCSKCKRRFDHEDMLKAHAKQLRRDEARRYVDQADAIATLKAQGRPERTVRKWLNPLRPLDVCEVCGEEWVHQEYAACPKWRDGSECGGLLHTEHVGDREAIIESYCDLRTRRRLVWWPDLWRAHLTTATRRRASA